MEILVRNRQERSRTYGVLSPSFSDRPYGQDQNGNDPESPHGIRSLQCSGDGPLKTRAESRHRLLFTRQHSTFGQGCQTRIWIDAAQGLSA